MALVGKAQQIQALIFLFLSLFISCGQRYTADTSPPSSTIQAEDVIGTMGGEIESPDSTWKLTIPAGALHEDIQITVTENPEDGPTIPDGYRLAGSYFKFEPAGLTFNEPVIFELMAEDGLGDLFITHTGFYNLDGDEPEAAEFTLDTTTGAISAAVPHFSFWGVLTIAIDWVAEGVVTNETIVEFIADLTITYLNTIPAEDLDSFYLDNVEILGPFTEVLVSILGKDTISGAFPDNDFDGDGTNNDKDPVGGGPPSVEADPPTITVTDPPSSTARYESGFLRGTVSDDSGISEIYAQINGGEELSLSVVGTDWELVIPTWADRIAEITLDITAVDTVENVAVESLNFRLGKNKDFNGDTYPDLVASAPYNNSNAGRVYIFNGSVSGLTDLDLSAGDSADTTISGETGSYAGFANATGDLNGDGYADLAIGGYTSQKVYILYGSASGIVDSDLASVTADTTLTGITLEGFGSGDGFGLGDIDGDGYDDIAVGGYAHNSSKGRVYIFYGSSSAIDDTDLNSQTADATITGEVNGTSFGYYVRLADLTGDGFAEIGIGAYQYNSSAGRLYMVAGASVRHTSIDFSAGDSPDATYTGTGGSYFGARFDYGDANGDGNGDIVVSAYQYPSTPGTGRAYVFTGEAGSLPTDRDLSSENADATLNGTGFGASFGRGVNFADVNGDGYDDVLTGASQTSQAYIFHGSASGITNTDLDSGGSANTLITKSSAGFGYAVAGADFDRDGYSDFVLAGFLDDSEQGIVYIFNGSSTGILDTDFGSGGSADVRIVGEAASDRFGNDVVW